MNIKDKTKAVVVVFVMQCVLTQCSPEHEDSGDPDFTIYPPGTTAIELEPNDQFTVIFTARYMNLDFFLQYKFNGTVIHRESNYERELQYFTSQYVECCVADDHPGEQCHELQLTVHGKEFVHDGRITFVAFRILSSPPYIQELHTSEPITVRISVDSPTEKSYPSTSNPTMPSTLSTVVTPGSSSNDCPMICLNAGESVASSKPPSGYVGYIATGFLSIALLIVTNILIVIFVIQIKYFKDEGGSHEEK